MIYDAQRSITTIDMINHIQYQSKTTHYEPIVMGI